MASNFGKTIQVSTFGASHGYAIGGIVEGLPCGHTIDIDELKAFLIHRYRWYVHKVDLQQYRR